MTPAEAKTPVATLSVPQVAGSSRPSQLDTSFAPGQQVRVVGLNLRPDLNGQTGTISQWDEKESRWKVCMTDGSDKMFKTGNPEVISDAAFLVEELSPLNKAAVVTLASPTVEGGTFSDLRVGQKVRVVGLKARPELNGQVGSLAEWSSGDERWRVRMVDGSGKMYKSANLEVMSEVAEVAATDSASLGPLNPFSPGDYSPAGEAPEFCPGQAVRVVGLKGRAELNGFQGAIVQWDLSENRWKVRMEDGSGKMFKALNLEVVAPPK